MSKAERIFHAVLFEVLAVTLAVTVLALFTDHGVGHLSGTMITVSTIAMSWNVVYNWIFDKLVPGDRVKRGAVIRVLHAIFFQFGLLAFTTPVIAFILGIGVWEALILDLGVTVVITIYTFVFNLIYDHTRAWIVRRKVILA